jgi:quercetin dioxygenase-like cupin family protein
VKLARLPFTVFDWSTMPATTFAGESGEGSERSFNFGNMRVRVVEYSPGYRADHWCDRGHVLFVLEGELISELKDGSAFRLKRGMSYQVSDFGDSPHRSFTETGARLFIVD